MKFLRSFGGGVYCTCAPKTHGSSATFQIKDQFSLIDKVGLYGIAAIQGYVSQHHPASPSYFYHLIYERQFVAIIDHDQITINQAIVNHNQASLSLLNFRLNYHHQPCSKHINMYIAFSSY